MTNHDEIRKALNRFCSHCGNDATCTGRYEHMREDEPACDDCCGHGCEDGRCEPIADVLRKHVRQLLADVKALTERAESAERELDVAKLFYDLVVKERDYERIRANRIERERDEARAERDARRAITREDQDFLIAWIAHYQNEVDGDYPTPVQVIRIKDALRAHAGKETHADDVAFDAFAVACKAKLADARAKGRSGWEACSEEQLAAMLIDHVRKGDPRDIANFCAFIWHIGRGESRSISAAYVARLDTLFDRLRGFVYGDAGKETS